MSRSLVVLFLSTPLSKDDLALFESLTFNVESFFDKSADDFKSLRPYLVLELSRF